MPSPSTVQFSLPSEDLEQLRSLATNGESIGLVAKRIVLEALGKPITTTYDNDRLSRLEARLEALEQKLETHKEEVGDPVIVNSEPKIDSCLERPQTEVDFFPNPLQPESKVLKKGYLIYWDKDLGDLRFWTGREWSTDISKAKVVESEKSAIASVKRLKKNGHAYATYEHLDVIYDRLPDEKRLVANTYWCE